MTLPLEGKRVLVTRAAEQAGRLSEGLRALGAVPVEVPVLEICPPESFDLLDKALQEFNAYDWLILTSANTVRVLAERASWLNLPLENRAIAREKPGGNQDELFGTEVIGEAVTGARFTATPAEKTRPQVAVVGRATAEAVCKTNLEITIVPESYLAESLLTAMANVSLRGKRILLARAAVARDVIPDALRAEGALIDVVDAYRNRLPESAPGLLRVAWEEGIDAATFTSSSSATHLAEAARAAGLDWPLMGVAGISIGPVTSKTLRELGWEPAAEADPYDIPGLIAAVVRVLGKK